MHATIVRKNNNILEHHEKIETTHKVQPRVIGNIIQLTNTPFFYGFRNYMFALNEMSKTANTTKLNLTMTTLEKVTCIHFIIFNPTRNFINTPYNTQEEKKRKSFN